MNRQPPKPIVFTDDDGVEHVLPYKWIVCWKCRGAGRCVAPGIDDNGITESEAAEDPEFMQDYMNGLYDVTCFVCDGLRVRAVVDEDTCDPAVLAAYQQESAERAAWDAQDEHERKMGY